MTIVFILKLSFYNFALISLVLQEKGCTFNEGTNEYMITLHHWLKVLSIGSLTLIDFAESKGWNHASEIDEHPNSRTYIYDRQFTG